MTSQQILAFRLNRGDTVRYDNRRQTVRCVEHVVYYPRNRLSGDLPGNGVRLTLRHDRFGTFTHVTLRNEETIRVYR
jgi:hypothetical protein